MSMNSLGVRKVKRGIWLLRKHLHIKVLVVGVLVKYPPGPLQSLTVMVKIMIKIKVRFQVRSG